jgi:protein-S-isoprenylcysteine O-methyltransferase Ste14
MSGSPSGASDPGSSPGCDRVPWRAVVGFVLYLGVLFAALFVASGRLDWWAAWGYVGILFASTAISRAVMAKKSPGLMAERGRYMQAEGVPAWDRWLMPIVGQYGPLATLIVAGLDQRFHWSPLLPWPIPFAGLAGVILSFALGVWALLVNRFFSAAVRIQTDRGHTVVTTGPYRVVRHPGYAAGIISALCVPLFLSSLWGLVPAGLSCAAIVARTLLEDRKLRAELPGYEDYARKTRFRLIPGLW